MRDADRRGGQGVAELLDPSLDVGGLDRGEAHGAQMGVDVASHDALHLICSRRAVHLPAEPLLRVFGQGDPARLWVDATTLAKGLRRFCEPPLGIDLAGELLRAFATGRVAVAGAPLAVRSFATLPMEPASAGRRTARPPRRRRRRRGTARGGVPS